MRGIGLIVCCQHYVLPITCIHFFEKTFNGTLYLTPHLEVMLYLTQLEQLQSPPGLSLSEHPLHIDWPNVWTSYKRLAQAHNVLTTIIHLLTKQTCLDYPNAPTQQANQLRCVLGCPNQKQIVLQEFSLCHTFPKLLYVTNHPRPGVGNLRLFGCEAAAF